MIRVGIIGTGFGLYGLLPAFAQTPGAKVVALAGKRSQRVQEALKMYQVPNHYESWQAMIDTESLQAVAIAVPPSIQEVIIPYVLKKKLHIFAEKPLATSTSPITDFIAQANSNTVTTCVDFVFPEIPVFLRAKDILNQHEIGNIQSISVSWEFLSYDIKHHLNSWKTSKKEGGGALSFYFSHTLYYLEWLLGPINITSSSYTHSPESLGGAEVGVRVEFTFDSNKSGIAEVCCNYKDKPHHTIYVRGEKGTLSLENTKDAMSGFSLKYTVNSKIEQTITNPLTTTIQQDERVSYVHSLTSKFIAACQQNIQTTPSFKEGYRVQELITIIDSYAKS